MLHLPFLQVEFIQNVLIQKKKSKRTARALEKDNL